MNTSVNVSQIIIPSWYTLIGQHIGYIVLGAIAFSTSSCISLSLLMKSIELRKGQIHILLTAMEVGNCILSASYILGGSLRLKYALTEEYKLTVSSWDCMSHPYVALYIFTLEFTPLILLVNACERWYAVYRPVEYFKFLHTRHQAFVLAIILIYCLMVVSAGIVCSYLSDQTRRWPYNCVTADAVGESFSKYHNSTKFLWTVLSGLVTLAIIGKFVRKEKTGPIPNRAEPQVVPPGYNMKQRALTKALIWSTVVVFLFMCFPFSIQFLIGGLGVGGSSLNQLAGPYNNFLIISHTICSDVILYSMNQQVRASVKNLNAGMKTILSFTPQ